MSLLDKLPKSLPFSKPTVKQEYFFAVNIGSTEVTGAVWGIEHKHLQLISSVSMNYQAEADLIEAINQVLDEALADFQPEPTKVLFGVPDSWLQDDNLKDEHLEFLKRLVKELDIEPMAYVSTTHAICHLLQKQHGVPATTILVEVAEPLSVTVVKAGKILGTKYIKRGSELAPDIEKALGSFNNIEVLPSKINLFGLGDLEKYKDKLLAFNWMSSLPFLHLPKVEQLDENIAIHALALAGASEVEPAVIYKAELLKPRQKKIQVSAAPAQSLSAEEDLEEEGGGFVAGDIAEELNPPMDRRMSARLPADPPEPEHVFTQSISLPDKVRNMLATFRPKIIESDLHKGRIPKAAKFLAVPLILVVVLLVGYLFFLKAQVTIFIDPKILEKDSQVIADPKATQTDETTQTIPGKVVETDISGTDKATASGQKQIGDPARGSVNVFNLKNSPVSLSKGTVLTTANGLKFTLDSAIDIASQSATVGADFTTTTTPGKTGSGVTASVIGPDGNLPSDTTLTVTGFGQSDVVAKVDTALSGGTSKNVTVVTSDDEDKLLASLAATLRQKAQTDLQAKLTGDQKILSEALDETITSKSYSKKIGDQATDFTLTLNVHYSGTSYSDNDLKLMVSKLVQTNVPDGYTLNLADTETQADVSKIDPNGRLIFLARFKAKLLPKLDLAKVADSIKGKSPAEAANVLKNIENVISSDIKIKPSLPGPLQRLPMMSKNISIQIQAN